MPCVYCNSTKRLSREHVVNAAAFRQTFGEKLSFIVQYDTIGEKDSRVDRIRDVCERCNNAQLQPYDKAGIQFVSAVRSLQTPAERPLPFDRNVLGWLLKTHLNILRKYGRRQPCIVDQRIYESLLHKQPVSPELFRLVLCVFNEDIKRFETRHGTLPLTWKIVTAEYETPRIMRSYFRMEHLETFLYLPSDAKYDAFAERVRTLLSKVYPDPSKVTFFDIEGVVRLGSIVMAR